MADDILKSYLVAIGFKLDEQEYKKFKDSQLDTEKRTKNLSKAFADFAKVGIGASVALGATVIKVTNDLEKLHFQAQKSGTSAQNLKAFGDAAAQIGIQAEDAMGIVQQFNNKIKDNPIGMSALLRNLGVDANQDKVKVLMDLVDSLAKISGPNADTIRVAYGAQFGLSGEDIRTLIRGREELHKYYEERRKVYGDIDRQSLAAHKANEEFRDLEARFNALTNAIGVSFLPLAKDVVSILEIIVQDLIAADRATDGWSSKLIGVTGALVGTIGALKTVGAIGSTLGIGGGGAAAGGSSIAAPVVIGTAAAIGGAYYTHEAYKANFNLSQEQKYDRQRKRIAAAKAAGIDTSKWEQPPSSFHPMAFSDDFLSRHPALGGGKASVKSLIDKYATQYGVDPALLEAQAWQESHYNPNALSKKGAIGVMQLIPATARGLGVDPFNTESNIEGGARMMAGLLRKYHGDTSLALAAYNAGEGRVDRAGGVPKIAETQDYVAAIQRRMVTQAAGNTISVKMDQKTDINVNGAGDAIKVADLVSQEQAKVNAGLARDFAGAVH